MLIPISPTRVSLIAKTRSETALSKGLQLDRLREQLAVAILALAICFNPLLAIANGHGAHMSGAFVALVQAALTFAALGVGALSTKRLDRWLVMAWLLVLPFVFLSICRSSIEPKNLGDVLLPVAFIALGQRFRPTTLVKLTAMLQLLIVAVGIFELAAPKLYAETFHVIAYYVSTRGFEEASFWAKNDLFLSSERPGGRLLLAGSGLHRGSSIFLEPVSLGNWIIVVAILLAGFWKQMSWRLRGFFMITNIVLLVVCDGRLAMGVLGILIVVLPISRRLPSFLSILWLPSVFLMLTLLSATGHLETVGDTLTGRLHSGYDMMVGLDLSDMMGVGNQVLNADAGWVYFIQTQSLVVAVFMWALITLTNIGEDSGPRMFKHGVALFLAVCLPISNSVLSIKTISLLWCTYGCFFARRSEIDDMLGLKKEDKPAVRFADSFRPTSVHLSAG